MSLDLGEFAFRVLGVLGLVRVHYLSVPITSGPNEIALLQRYGCTREELRSDHAAEFRSGVITPNERQAAKYAQMLRERDPGITVINPGGLYVPEWGQDEYMAFWTATIRAQVATLVVPPETIFSTGGREEICLALQTQVPVVDLHLQPLGVAGLTTLDEWARSRLRGPWTEAQIDAYMPPIDWARVAPTGIVDLQAAETFGKLAADHNLRSQGH